VCHPLLQAFPFPSTGGGDTAPAFSGLRVYLQLTWEVGPPPFSCGVFLPPLLLQVFPLLITVWCCCSCQRVCLQLTWEVGLPPISCGVFLPPPLSQAFSCSWLLGAPPPRASPAKPSLFIYSSRKGSPPPFFGAQCAPPSSQHVFIVLIAYYSVSLFSPGGGWSVQGAMLWPRVVSGSTTVLLSSLCLCLPKPSGHGQVAARRPSWFLHLT
jgi:hypothetical protein